MNATLILLVAAAAPGASGPLQTANASVDHGEVKAGTILAHTFPLKNTGTSPVTIADVETACGCLRPRISSTTIAPGESTDVRVEINTIAQPAAANSWKVAVCYWSGPEGNKTAHELDLVQKARIVREFDIEPVALVLSIERETSHKLTLSDRRAKPLTITEARCGHKHVKTQIGAVGVNARGERIQQVQVTVLEACPGGFYSEVLQLLTDDPAYRELRIPLTIVRKGPGQITATPETLTLRLAQGQKAASGLVRLRDPDDRTVVVEKMEIDDPVLRTKWAAGPGAMATLRLGVELAAEPTSGIGSVRVYIKEPKPQILVIPVIWQAP
jgi:Protein of unknown function (DUF1573)